MPEQKRHYAVIERYPRKLTVLYQDEVVAETHAAMILKEVNGDRVYNPVFYIPQADLKMNLEMNPEPKGYCPIKGRSRHWNHATHPAPNYLGWSYEDPLPGSEAIQSHIAFNLNDVTLISAPPDA